MMLKHTSAMPPLELWGGVECTVNRVADTYFNQLERSGHAGRDDDIERFAALGIRALRYPVLWERTAPTGLAEADWQWPDRRLHALREAGVTPIAGLVHHGSGPPHTSLVSPDFAAGLAEFAGAVAQRYPWIEYYTPINEPLTTARFSGLYGLWYPHGKDERSFVQALLNQCRAVVLSMRAIRAVNPQAKLVQTDDLGKNYSTPQLRHLAEFYNERRWLGWDLLCGKVGPEHKLWDYLVRSGVDSAELLWFRDNSCPPDIIGVNYYITSERWLDHRVERFPEHYVNRGGPRPVADIETARALAHPVPGIAPLLQEAWERYGIPLAVTEVHIDSTREDQLRWLLEIWEGCQQARRNGVEVRAATVWALLGTFDWNTLVTQNRGYYEPGAFDVRAPEPRPTAVATLVRELADDGPLSHPVLQGPGWWRRGDRFFCEPVANHAPLSKLAADGHMLDASTIQPILITGATGTLGRAFARICTRRNLSFKLMSRQEMDIANPASVEAAVARYQPWAIINASGYVRVDDAESDIARCFRENAEGPALLAAACARHRLQLLTFSSDLVFDGRQSTPYVESDRVAPLNIYGHSKAAAERRVLDRHPEALVVRTSSFFGPWDRHNFVTQALEALKQGVPFTAANDMTVSPTYVPDLVNCCLDLLIDRHCGILHLTNGEALSWSDLALKSAGLAGVDASRLQPVAASACGLVAARPRYSALSSECALPMPPLDDALARYLAEHRAA